MIRRIPHPSCGIVPGLRGVWVPVLLAGLDQTQLPRGLGGAPLLEHVVFLSEAAHDTGGHEDTQGGQHDQVTGCYHFEQFLLPLENSGCSSRKS